jgi:hypothetical protein
MRTVKSRGPDTPTLVSRLATTLTRRAGNGGQKARSTGENAKQPFQPLRGECRVFSAEPVVPAACIFFAGGPWVRPAPGIPRALCLKRAGPTAKLGRDQRRENADVCHNYCLERHDELRAVSPAVFVREGDDPVRRGLSIQALPSLEYWITRLRG